MTYALSDEQLAALLGRSLSPTESKNRVEYLNIAKELLESLLGLKVDGTNQAERRYEAREGYRSLLVDPFTGVPTVIPVTKFRPRQGDDYNAVWFDAIEFETAMEDGTVYMVRADWGYGSKLPNGLARLWAGLFELAANQSEVLSPKVKSESVLSHSVTFDTSDTAYQRFVAANAELISRYGRINVFVLNGSAGV